MPKIYSQFVGIDVSKDKVDVYQTKNKKHSIFLNNETGIKEFLKEIKPESNTLVLIDLTGGYEKLFANALVSYGFDVHRAQGRRVKSFSKGIGQEAKTDKIDAQILTEYGRTAQAKLRLYKEETNYLKELNSRREDIVEMLNQEKIRKEHFSHKMSLKTFEENIANFEKQIDDLDKEIKNQINNDKELKEKAKVILSTKSIGHVTTGVLLANLSELGHANRREIAALVGVAPYANDSGKTLKKRKTGVGRSNVKRALYMCTMNAIQKNNEMKAFYDKLCAKGKLKMVAIVAVMRKLLIIVNNKCKEFYAKRDLMNS